MLDSTDKQILSLLQNDAKITIKEIAAKLNRSTTPIFERIKKLEKEGIIEGYQTIINKEQLGLGLMVFCNVTLKQHQKELIEEFEKDVHQFSEVMACYHIGGMYDYLVQVCVEDMDTYQHFVSRKLAELPSIQTVQSSFVMKEIVKNIGIQIDL